METLPQDPLDGYRHIDAAAVLAGNLEPPEPDILARTDGRRLLYSNRLHWFQGEPESGKTWLALAAVVEVLRSGGVAVYVDFEDSPRSVFGRLVALNPGLRDGISWGFRYIQPSGPVTPAALEHCAEIEFSGAALVVIDACTESMVSDGLNPDWNQDVAKWVAKLPDAAKRAGAAAVVIDHVTKDRDQRGRWAIGGGHKLGYADVAYQVRCYQPIAPGKVGRASVDVAKDRLGGVRAFALGKRAAEFVVDAAVPNCCVVALLPPKEWAGPTTKMATMMDTLQGRTNQEALTRNRINQMFGDGKDVREATERLIADGQLIPDGMSRGQPTYLPAPLEAEEDGA